MTLKFSDYHKNELPASDRILFDALIKAIKTQMQWVILAFQDSSWFERLEIDHPTDDEVYVHLFMSEKGMRDAIALNSEIAKIAPRQGEPAIELEQIIPLISQVVVGDGIPIDFIEHELELSFRDIFRLHIEFGQLLERDGRGVRQFDGIPWEPFPTTITIPLGADIPSLLRKWNQSWLASKTEAMVLSQTTVSPNPSNLDSPESFYRSL